MTSRPASGSPATTTVAGPARSARRTQPRRLVCTRTYGLTPAELRSEMRRLTSRGWQLWEIARTFGCGCTSKDSNE